MNKRIIFFSKINEINQKIKRKEKKRKYEEMYIYFFEMTKKCITTRLHFVDLN